MKKLLILLALGTMATACTPLKGKWHFKSYNRLTCDYVMGKAKNCKPITSIPGKIQGCDVTAQGTMTFSAEKQGTFTKKLTLRALCPNRAPIVQKVDLTGKFWIVKKNKKTYLYFQVGKQKSKLLLVKSYRKFVMARVAISYTMLRYGGHLVIKKMFIIDAERYTK